MATHAPRWQATLILLCDALSVSPGLLTPERLERVRGLGRYVECMGTCVHDLSRADRDARAGGPNAFLVWCRVRGRDAGDTQARADFLVWSLEWLRPLREHFLASTGPDELFDLGLFDQTLSTIREHYGV